MNRTFAIHTLGCKVNQEESAALVNVFAANGWRQVPFGEAADVCIVNTCTVTQIAEKKSRNMLRRAAAVNPAVFVVATGCYVQMKPDEAAGIAGIDLLVGANEKHRIFELAANGAAEKERRFLAVVSRAREVTEYHEIGCSADMQIGSAGRTRAFVKIEDGCNQFCTYCIVPYVRGPVRSRPERAIIEEIAALVAAGYREVVLTGIHVGAYGSEREGADADKAFAGLVAAAAAVPGLKRLRLGSVEPHEISDELIELAAASDVICPHFHIPLQAASDKVLDLMGRTYDTGFFMELLAKIRRAIPEAAITTDIIAGFPGEDGQDFAAARELVSRMRFADAHIFPYSRRPGTPAADYPGQLSNAVKAERAKELAAAVSESRREFRSRHIGRELSVLAEQKSERGGISGVTGYTADYVPVFVVGADEGCIGSFVSVMAEGLADSGELIAKLI